MGALVGPTTGSSSVGARFISPHAAVARALLPLCRALVGSLQAPSATAVLLLLPEVDHLRARARKEASAVERRCAWRRAAARQLPNSSLVLLPARLPSMSGRCQGERQAATRTRAAPDSSAAPPAAQVRASRPASALDAIVTTASASGSAVRRGHMVSAASRASELARGVCRGSEVATQPNDCRALHPAGSHGHGGDGVSCLPQSPRIVAQPAHVSWQLWELCVYSARAQRHQYTHMHTQATGRHSGSCCRPHVAAPAAAAAARRSPLTAGPSSCRPCRAAAARGPCLLRRARLEEEKKRGGTGEKQAGGEGRGAAPHARATLGERSSLHSLHSSIALTDGHAGAIQRLVHLSGALAALAGGLLYKESTGGKGRQAAEGGRT